MDITRRCDYALRILEAAYQRGDAYISVSDISEQEEIPYAFARSIQHDLVKGGLIKTVRGARGGLALDCNPATTTLLEVLEVVQGPVSVSLCTVDKEYCKRCGGCSYHKLWIGADSILNGYFASITLKELIDCGGKLPQISNAISCSPENARMSCPVDAIDDDGAEGASGECGEGASESGAGDAAGGAAPAAS